MPAKLAAGNWKMNGTTDSLGEIGAIAAAAPDVPILICPPATLITAASTLATGTNIQIGGQDCHAQASGAHTGDLSAQMLSDAGASHVIVGHSERRTDHGESDATVKAKAEAALDAGLTAIVCIGETQSQREAGEALRVVGTQLAGSLPTGATSQNTVVAYEPVWAIGTGLTATAVEINEVHRHLRAALKNRGLADMTLLYGGSVKAAIAAEIFAVPDVDGALVGGASLKAADFGPIAQALADA